MKTIPLLLFLFLLFQGTALATERQISFDHPGQEASSWKWLPITLTASERELFEKRSDSPKTALDYYFLLSDGYFENIASEAERRVTFIVQETLSDRYLHAEYTIPSVDAGAFWITIRLFEGEEGPLVAIRHRGGNKRLFGAKENGPLGLWSVTLASPEFWTYQGGAFEKDGALVRLRDSVIPALGAEEILARYRNHYKAHLNEPTQKKSIFLGYELPQEGNIVQVTGRENWMDPDGKYVWAEFSYDGDQFVPSTKSEDAADKPAPDSKAQETPKPE